MSYSILSLLKHCRIHFFYVSLAIFFLATGKMHAQLQPQVRQLPNLEFQVWGSGGFAGSHYNVSGGTSSLQFGAQAGLGFAYFFHPNWAVGAGLEFGSYHTKASLYNGTTIAAPATDENGTIFEWQVTALGYQEEQRAYILNLPVTLQYQYFFSKTIGLYAKGGIKFGFPCYHHYDATATSLVTSGYYPATNTWVTYDPDLGFGSIDNYASSGNLDLNLSYSATAEIGAKFYLWEKLFLYMGAYIDYGLNAICKSDVNSLLDYQPKNISRYQSGHSMVKVKPLVNESKLLAYGVTLRLALGIDYERPKKVRRYECNCE